MELRQLRYFVAVAQRLSFTRAAQQLHVAQPALSRQVRLLEEELGIKLLERNRRGTELTEPGRAFLAEACALLEQSARAIAVAQKTQRSSSAQLNLGYIWGLFHSLVPPAISRFRQILPETAVNLFDLSAIEQAQALLDGKLDAGFIGFAQDAQAPGLARRKIGSCPFVVALPARHPLARLRRVPLERLAGESFLSISEQTYPGAWHLIVAACAGAGFRPRTLQAVERGYTILGLVAGNCGIALLPDPLRNLPHQGVLFRPLLEPVEADLFVAWRPAVRLPGRDTFLSLFPEGRG
jgi:DNA-binding transcriptional LysR family regulator